MENQPTFRDLTTFSSVVYDNEFFTQFTNQDLPKQYDSNFITLKYPPTLPEFKLIEKMHREYQQSIGQQHLKINWPDDTGLFVNVLDYLNQQNYNIGKQKLAYIKAEYFTLKQFNHQVNIESVTDKSFAQFLEINYEEDLSYGREYAEHKQSVYHYQYRQPCVQFLLAKTTSDPVGSLVLIHSNDYIEIDNVLTSKTHRNTGIASSMLHFVINEILKRNQIIILAVDAEDTPKEMYKKLGFEMIASQISAQNESNRGLIIH